MSQVRKTISVEFVLTNKIAEAINQWLHTKGDDVHKYAIFLDRVCDLREVIVDALDQTNKVLELPDAAEWVTREPGRLGPLVNWVNQNAVTDFHQSNSSE